MHLPTILFTIVSIWYSQAKALIRYYQYCTCHDKNREEALHVLQHRECAAQGEYVNCGISHSPIIKWLTTWHWHQLSVSQLNIDYKQDRPMVVSICYFIYKRDYKFPTMAYLCTFVQSEILWFMCFSGQFGMAALIFCIFSLNP